MVLYIGIELRFEPLQVADGSPVGAPCEFLCVRRVGTHDTAHGCAGYGLDHRDVFPPVRIHGPLMRANEGDPAPIGRPGGQVFVELRIGGQLLGMLAIHIEDVQMPLAPLGKVSVLVLLEVPRIDHDGLGRRIPLALHHREREMLAVRCPRILADVACDGAQRAGIAAAPVEQHDLAFLGARGRRDE